MHVILLGLHKILTLGRCPGGVGGCSPLIDVQAWRQTKQNDCLAVWTKTGCLIIRHQADDDVPLVVQVPWPPQEGAIKAMCFSPDGMWLLCVTDKHWTILIPTQNAQGDSDSDSDGWKRDDVTRYQWDEEKGPPACATWWTMLSGEHVAVIATKKRKLLFMELVSGHIMFEEKLLGEPQSVAIFKENRSTYAVVWNKNGRSNKFLIEQEMNLKRTQGLHGADNIIKLPYAGDSQAYNVFSCQEAWDQSLITALFNDEGILRVFDSLDSFSPLYEYYMPRNAHQVLLTDHLLYCATDKGLAVLSVEAALVTYQEKISRPRLQLFTIPDGETIQSLVKLEPPDTTDHPQGPKSTKLHGCLVVTQKSVYKCTMIKSPEDVYLELILKDPNGESANNFAEMIRIDSRPLLKEAALKLLKDGRGTDLVKSYFNKARTPDWEQAFLFNEHEEVECAREISDQVWLTPKEIPVEYRARMAALKVSLILQSSPDEDQVDSLRRFLLNNTWYDPDAVFLNLVNNGYYDLVIQVCKIMGMLPECCEAFICEPTNSDPENQQENQKLVKLLDTLSCDELVNCFAAKSSLLSRFVSRINRELNTLGEHSLTQIVNLVSPSQPHYTRLHLLENRDTKGFADSGASDVYKNWGSSGGKTSPLFHLYVDVVLCLLSLKNKEESIIAFGRTRSHRQRNIYQTQQRDTESDKEDEVKNTMSSGRQHSAAILDGRLYTWGRAAHGRLGSGHRNSECEVSPEQVPSLIHIQVQAVSCGTEHTLALTQKGLYSWGNSSLGQTGHGHRYRVVHPMRLPDPPGAKWSSIQCGQFHSLAVTTQGSIYCWGWGVYGQLGLGSVEDVLRPTLNRHLGGHIKVKQIAAGYAHTLFLTQQGEVYSCGLGKYGQLGFKVNLKLKVPQKVMSIKPCVEKVATNYFINLALTKGGTLLTWGSHPRDAASNKSTTQHEPISVDTLNIEESIDQIACGEYFCAATTGEGEVYTWGLNYEGQLGNGNRREQKTPDSVMSLTYTQVGQITCGAHFMLAMDEESELYGWGANRYGQCGCTKVTPSAPTDIYNAREEVTVPSMQQSFVKPQKVDFPETAESHISDDIEMLQTIDLAEDESDTVCFLVKVFPNQLSIPRVIQSCVKLSQWNVAADIMFSQQQFTKACSYMLKTVNSRDVNNEEKAKQIIDYTGTLLTSVHDACFEISQEHDNVKEILIQICECWRDETLPIEMLQAFLESQLHLYMYPICLLLFWEECDWTQLFPPDFLLGVTQRVSDRLLLDDSKECTQFHIQCANSPVDWMQGLVNSTSGPPKASLKTEDSITLTKEQLQQVVPEYQEEELNKEPKNVENTEKITKSASEVCITLFTCGHVYQQADFEGRLLPAFERECETEQISGDLVALPIKMYKNMSNEGHCELACPSCMFSQIK